MLFYNIKSRSFEKLNAGATVADAFSRSYIIINSVLNCIYCHRIALSTKSKNNCFCLSLYSDIKSRMELRIRDTVNDSHCVKGEMNF
jgi:hypothetical protein